MNPPKHVAVKLHFSGGRPAENVGEEGSPRVGGNQNVRFHWFLVEGKSRLLLGGLHMGEDSRRRRPPVAETPRLRDITMLK